MALRKYLIIFCLYGAWLSSPVGLENIGNICYMNAVLQALFACEPLNKELQDKRLALNPIVSEYAALMRSAREEQGGKLSPASIVTCSYLQKFFPGDNPLEPKQQDASEFLGKFIENLPKKVQDLFAWSYLTFPENRTDKPIPLQGLINEQDVPHKKILVIRLIREMATPVNEVLKTEKITNATPLPADLSLKIGNETYKLFSCIIHYGDTGGGHYSSVVRHGTQWYYCDDLMVKSIAEQETIRYTDGPHMQGVVYLFERVDQENIDALFKELQRNITALYLVNHITSLK